MTDKLIGIVSDIVASYVCNNSVPPAEMPNLINSVYKALAAIDAPVAITETASPSQKPTAGQIRKSITPSALISFIDGQLELARDELSGVESNLQSFRERNKVVAPEEQATLYLDKVTKGETFIEEQSVQLKLRLM
jgi:hypothetical protein